MESDRNATSNYPEASNREPDPTEDESDSDEPIILEKWPKLVNAIVAATREAFPSSPPFHPASPFEFQSYWHDTFSRLRDSVLSDPDIPEIVTSPPVKEFDINLFSQKHALGCPCCLPDIESQLIIRNEAGVTKGDFIKGLADYLYGQSLPTYFGEDESCVESEALIYSTNWMSGGKDKETGLRTAFLKNPADGPSKPEIWLYCCTWKEFKTRQDAGDKDAKRDTNGKEKN